RRPGGRAVSRTEGACALGRLSSQPRAVTRPIPCTRLPSSATLTARSLTVRVLLPVLATALTLGCARPPDRLSYTTLASEAEDRPMTYGLYLPPGWDQQTPLPLVVFLHGGGDDERAWDDHPVVTKKLDA